MTPHVGHEEITRNLDANEPPAEICWERVQHGAGKKKKLPTAVYQITWCLTMRERTNTGREERHEEPTKTQKKIKVLLFLNSLSYLLKMQRVLTTNKEQLCSCQMDMVGETLK